MAIALMNSEQDSTIQTLLTKIDKASQTQNWAECNNYIQQLPVGRDKTSLAQLNTLTQQQILKFAVKILTNGDFQDKWDIAKIFPLIGESSVEVLSSLLSASSSSYFLWL